MEKMQAGEVVRENDVFPSVRNTKKITFEPDVLETVDAMTKVDGSARSHVVNHLVSTHPEYTRFQKMRAGVA